MDQFSWIFGCQISDMESKLGWIDVKWTLNSHTYSLNGLKVTPFHYHTRTCLPGLPLVRGTSVHCVDVTIEDIFSWILGCQMSAIESKLAWIDVKWVSNLRSDTFNGLEVTPFQPHNRTCLHHHLVRGTSSHCVDDVTIEDQFSWIWGC